MNERLGEVTLRAGDVLVLQGSRRTLPALLQDFACLPLAQRDILLGTSPPRLPAALDPARRHGATAPASSRSPSRSSAAAVAMVVFRVIPLRRCLQGARRPDPDHAGHPDPG
jgi:hypothetical protein